MSSGLPTVGDVFQGRYIIEEPLGAGGFAQVYRARQTDLDRAVALKILKSGPADEEPSEGSHSKHETFVRRFVREAKMISRLRDPHTVIMYDYGQTDDGHMYMILELVDGETLSQVVRQQGAVAPARAAQILRQIMRSLREAHALDVLHRDIKPQNIMVFDHLGDTDQVKVLDFGIAKSLATEGPVVDATTDLTGSGDVLIGTPRYMSPEQIRGDELTPASDLYSVGLVMFELLVGRRAVDEPTTMRIITRHLGPESMALPQTLDIPAGLRQIVDRMLEKDLAKRYRKADEVLADLEYWDKAQLGPGAIETLGGPPRASRWRIAAIVAALVGLAGVSVAAGTMLASAPQPTAGAMESGEDGVATVESKPTPVAVAAPLHPSSDAARDTQANAEVVPPIVDSNEPDSGNKKSEVENPEPAEAAPAAAPPARVERKPAPRPRVQKRAKSEPKPKPKPQKSFKFLPVE